MLSLVCLLSCVALVLSSPGGAPETACVDMIPNHPAPDVTEGGPFTVTTSASSYAPGDVIDGEAI